MENLDLTVLRALLGWRTRRQRAVLATVIKTWGSSPRPVGSVMALCETGAVVGSVSGGCIEDDLIDRYSRSRATPAGPAASADIAHDIPAGPPQRVQYGVSADEAHRFGLPCGGTLELLLEFNPDAGALADLVQLLDNGHLVQRRIELATGRVELQVTQQPSALADHGHWLSNTFGPQYRMLLIGAGQLTEYLATMAQFSGFTVTVCDPREQYHRTWSVPGATLVTGMPDDVVRGFGVDRRSCVIAITHDPKLDDLALLEALDTEAFYVGAIGSRRNNAARQARMVEHFDLTPQRLERLRGPIGIYIGSKTPAEIAVSVMAEVLAVKNGVPLPRGIAVAVAKNTLDPKAPDAPSASPRAQA
ncbi:MAG: XdhC family protein [Hydrogenophaga sp.]